MNALTHAHAELRLLVNQLEEHAAVLRTMPRRRHQDALRWEDHRTHTASLLWETLDRIEPGLGLRFINTQHANGVGEMVVAAPMPDVSAATGTPGEGTLA